MRAFFCSLLEPAKLLVFSEHKSKGRRHDVIWRTADEFGGVAVEGLSERLFKLEFACNHLGWFLDRGRSFSLRGFSGLIRVQHRRNLLVPADVLWFMESGDQKFGAPEWLILIGAVAFILVLGISAYWEPDIRVLHFFQAWMYIATMILSFRGSRWGHFIGVSAAGFWNYVNLFAVRFFFNGLEQLALWVRTGHLARPDIFIAVPAWFSNLLVICGCLWAYSRLRERRVSDTWKFAVAFALTTGFFALDMALFQARYLGIFPRLLHPHLP